MRHLQKQLFVQLIRTHILPDCPLVQLIRCHFQIRRRRIPPFIQQGIKVGLAAQKIRIQHMPQFMGKQPTDNLVAVFPSPYFRNHRMPCIDADYLVVGICPILYFRFPVDADMNPPVIMVPFCLCHCHILKMPGQYPGCKKLLIRDLAPFFVH